MLLVAVSGEAINTELFINKHQLKDALEREWNRREAVDTSRIQYKLKCLDGNGKLQEKLYDSLILKTFKG